MPRLCKLLTFFVLLACFAIHAQAYDNYRSSSYQDSYYQSWDSYKQQNSIKTESYAQKSWWSNAFTKVTNFLADVGSAINKALNSIGSFFSNAYHSIKNIFVKTPEVKTSDIKTSDIKASVAQEKFVPYEDRLSGKDKAAWGRYKDEHLKRDPDAMKQAQNKTYTPKGQFSYEQKERLWFDAFLNLRADDRAKYDLPTAQEQAVIDWQAFALPENADKYGFFDVFSPDVKVNSGTVLDRIEQDFTLYKNMDLTQKQIIDGSLDIARRAGTYVAGKAVGSTASDLAKTAGMDQVGQFMASKMASDMAKDALPKTNVLVNAADQAIFKDIGKSLSELKGYRVVSATYQQNIIGPKEADRYNRDQKLGPYAAGAVTGTIAGVATATVTKSPQVTIMAGVKTAFSTASVINTVIRQQPYEAGQVERVATIVYDKPNHPLYTRWAVTVNYRIGTYSNNGRIETGVIEADYKSSFRDDWDTLVYLTEQGANKHAPK